jgi:lysophospholipase L1-like esterase
MKGSIRNFARAWLAAGLLALCVTQQARAAGAQEAMASGGAGARWVAAWTSAPIRPGVTTISALFGNDLARTFDDQTVRNIARVGVGGRKVRVRVSNEFGTRPLRLGAAYVALRRQGAAIHAGTSRRLTFGGQAAPLIPAGAALLSDAADLEVPAAAEVAVSLYLPDAAAEPATYHEETLVTSYLMGARTGNLANAADLPAAAPTTSTFYATAVEVLASEPVRAVVAIGDSITQGAGSTRDQHRGWPDLLSARLNAARPRVAVLNQGVGCGRLLWDFCGPGGLARFDRDVLAVSGVTHVIVHLGLNDITIPSILPLFGQPQFAAEAVTPGEIIAGLGQLAQRARARGLRVIGATITPIGSSTVPGAFTPENEARRQAVNRWIRTAGAFDGVIDFDAALRDPVNLSRMQAQYDADGIHPNDAGHQVMANAINLALLF